MKSILLVVIILTPMLSLAQKPSIMVIPAEIYMSKNGYGDIVKEVGGIEDFRPDYPKLFLNDRYARTVIAAIDRAFLDFGYNTTNMESALRALETNQALSAASERQAQVSMRDRLLSSVRSDIYIDVDFNIEEQMGSPIVNFTLQAFDTYTAKLVASSPNMATAPGGATPIQTLVQEAVIKNMPSFEQKFIDHFNDIVQNGRTAVVSVSLSEDCPFDLEEWFGEGDDEDELRFIIRELVKDATVDKAPRAKTSTRTLLEFEDVRVPLYNDDGEQQDVETWARNIIRELRRQYKLDVKSEANGLGSVRLIIMGER